MAKKRKRWEDKLTSTERKHLKEWVGDTKKSLEATFKIQILHRKEERGFEPCFICKGIAVKLGMEI